ncbi:hypothetical protein BH24ACT21_BH24ACT21_07990 [soil metagenome]
MAKKGHNPFRGFVDSISEANRMREHWMTGYDPTAEERTHANAWVPTTDIYATQDGYLVIRCEIAGVARNALDISFSNSVLTISGERRERPEEVTYYAHERHYGHFRRSMTLPESVKDDDINANFEDGMLEVLVKGGASPREPTSIEIGTTGE